MAWLVRVTAPALVPPPPNILLGSVATRTYSLKGTDALNTHTPSWAWEEIPSGTIERFVGAFERSEGTELFTPYVQFSATTGLRAVSCITGLTGYDTDGKVSQVKGTIRPTQSSHAVYHSDGSVIFTDVHMELTTGAFTARSLSIASVTITPVGRMFAVEAPHPA